MSVSLPIAVSIVIPTFGRDRVLVETIESLLHFEVRATEILVVDQTAVHDQATEAQLTEWNAQDRIRWIRVARPSITGAMNLGLKEAKSPLVLFLDDDIVPHHNLVAAHSMAHHEFGPAVSAVVGQVLQPEDEPRSRDGYRSPKGFFQDMAFPFWSTERAWIANVMAGNLSVKREEAIAAGGFDENFTGVAYRFETEFCRRLLARGGKVLFEPKASIRHLRAARGGTRSTGSHLTSISPIHGQGDYYFAIRSGLSVETLRYICKRPFREVMTRFHLKHPWYIPVKFVGELRALYAGWRMAQRGPRFIDVKSDLSVTAPKSVVVNSAENAHPFESPET